MSLSNLRTYAKTALGGIVVAAVTFVVLSPKTPMACPSSSITQASIGRVFRVVVPDDFVLRTRGGDFRSPKHLFVAFEPPAAIGDAVIVNRYSCLCVTTPVQVTGTARVGDWAVIPIRADVRGYPDDQCFEIRLDVGRMHGLPYEGPVLVSDLPEITMAELARKRRVARP